MSQHSEEFLVASEIKAFDLEHRRTINYNMGKYETAVSTGLSRFQHLENSKRRAHTIKWKTMENLDRSEEHTSELQSLMRISYAVFCLKKTNIKNTQNQV